MAKRPDHQPVEMGDRLAPGIGYYEDLVGMQRQTIREQQQVIETLTGVIQRLSKADPVVEAEVSF